MNKIRVEVQLIFLGVAVLTLSLIVIFRNESLDDELLASIGVLGGAAIIVNSVVMIVTSRNGNGNGAGHK